ncbi:pectate lyase [Natranaerovirga hydrolytica]|uniref:Pectate lyase n=1 Tax=Natranaerovirga hydrolytica TaxID=680378 RepID=A0A4R1MYS8_9FIRM|nr:pectate lyase [Natranaerovirga hydrolytica]TCK98467.1 pectate lyase [Natranaerovirga hydrolytica]
MDHKKRALNVITEYLDNVLKYGRDQYNHPKTPLFADGINIKTKEQMTWQKHSNHKIVMSNLANQQNLFRLLYASSLVLEDDQYVNAAKEALQYHFNHLVDESGLMQWGGHRLINLETLQIDGPENKHYLHEFKHHFPFYELMNAVNPKATENFISAFWNAHISNWSTLEFNRHGDYGLEPQDVWNKSFEDPEPFQPAKGLTFINAGNDLIYSAGMLYKFTKNEAVLKWAKRLIGMYVKARHPKTSLGVYQYTQNIKQYEPPTDESDPTFTYSFYGDRAKRQFGKEFGDVALEGNVIFERHAKAIYIRNVLVQLELAEQIKDKEILDWTIKGLKSFYQYGYNKHTNQLKPMFADGTDLTDYKIKRKGYYGEKGYVIKSYWTGLDFLYSLVKGYSVSKDDDLWQYIQSIMQHNQLAKVGNHIDDEVILFDDIESTDVNGLFSAIELYKATKNKAYIQMAETMAQNIMNEKFKDGFFVEKDTINASFDAVEPLAILSLESIKANMNVDMPQYLNSEARLHGKYVFDNGLEKNIYSNDLYNKPLGSDSNYKK